MMPRTRIEEQVPRTLAAANLSPRGRVFASPAQWRDQILYQLLPDRFSDGLDDTVHQPGKAGELAAHHREIDEPGRADYRRLLCLRRDQF